MISSHFLKSVNSQPHVTTICSLLHLEHLFLHFLYNKLFFVETRRSSTEEKVKTYNKIYM